MCVDGGGFVWATEMLPFRYCYTIHFFFFTRRQMLLYWNHNNSRFSNFRCDYLPRFFAVVAMTTTIMTNKRKKEHKHSANNEEESSTIKYYARIDALFSFYFASFCVCVCVGFWVIWTYGKNLTESMMRTEHSQNITNQ